MDIAQPKADSEQKSTLAAESTSAAAHEPGGSGVNPVSSAVPPLESDGAQEAQKIAAEAEGGSRVLRSWESWLISAICLSWTLFQLYVAYVPTNSTLVRSIHLGFALGLTYLLFPFSKRLKIERRGIPIWDLILAVLAANGALYITFNWTGIAERAGDVLPVEIYLGTITLMLLLEAARRALGMALTIIGIIFLGYSHFGPYMPDLIAHKGASVIKLVNHMYLTSEGVFGVPLGVSAGFVFLFVLFGAMLECAGGGRYFIQVAYAALGGLRGGPAKASVMASGMTGMISGSSIANTVTTGTFTIPLMKRVGLPAHKAGAVEVAASTNGQLMPPVMGAAAFIISEFLGISYVDVIRAAFLPAVVSYMALFYIVHLEASKLGIVGVPRAELPRFWPTFARGLHFLIPVVVLIFYLIFLRRSPAGSALNAIMVLMLLMLLQHPVRLRWLGENNPWRRGLQMGFGDLLSGFITGARNMVAIGVATAAAGIIVGTITLTGIGQVLTEVIEVLSGGNLVLVLAFTAVISLVLGMGLPTTANYIVMASLTAPVVLELGEAHGLIIPAIAAHLFVFYFGILADDTPPVGLAAYAASAIARSHPIRTGIQGFTYDIRTALLPFMFVFNTKLLLISGVVENPSEYVWITNPLLVLLIFASAVLAMFAFASLIQGYFLTRNTVFEGVVLALITIVLFRSDALQIFFPSLGGYGDYLSYALGFCGWGWLYERQQRRIKRQKTLTAA